MGSCLPVCQELHGGYLWIRPTPTKIRETLHDDIFPSLSFTGRSRDQRLEHSHGRAVRSLRTCRPENKTTTKNGFGRKKNRFYGCRQTTSRARLEKQPGVRQAAHKRHHNPLLPSRSTSTIALVYSRVSAMELARGAPYRLRNFGDIGLMWRLTKSS